MVVGHHWASVTCFRTENVLRTAKQSNDKKNVCIREIIAGRYVVRSRHSKICLGCYYSLHTLYLLLFRPHIIATP